MKKKVLSILFIIILISVISLVIFLNGGNSRDREKSLAYAEYEAIDPVDIWLATDTHYIAPELTDNGQFYQKMVNSGDGKYMYGCEELTDAFIEEVVEAHPTALILAGDLTFNGAKISHEALAQKISPIEQAGIPIIAIPGNHDLTINRAAKFHGNDYELVGSIDASEYIDIYGEYGLNEAIARDDTSLSYVAEIAPNLRVLVVDVNTVPGMSGILTKATLEFVEEQLIDAANNHAYVIGVTHQTLLVHSELTSQGITFINNDKLLALYEKYNVLLNLSGHMHIQHIKESENGFVEISTGALMTSPNYHAKIHLEGREFSYQAVPTIVEKSDINEKSKDFLWNNGYRQGQEQLSDNPNKDEMAAYFADFNVNYIAGRPDQIPWNDDISKKWGETDTFVPLYLQYVADEVEQVKNADFTQYKLKW